jgi:acetyl-CoA/propionyl-CoA carboxylase biotin carboxyl carrier protein
VSISKDFDHGGQRLRVQLSHIEGERYRVLVGDADHEVTARLLPDGRVRFQLDGSVFHAVASCSGTGKAVSRRGDVHVSLGEETWMLTGGNARSSRAVGGHDVAGDGIIVAPMTGTVLSIQVREGDTVSASDAVAIVSAMKMEHKLLAGVDGTIVEVAATEGATVEQDEVILRVEPVD